jgi:hypothetical protein
MKVGIALLVFLSYAAAARAAEIHGKVLNAQGEAVVGARVTVAADPGKGRGQSVREQATTGPDGTYSIAGLRPGPYTLLVALPGNQSTLRRPVNIRSESDSIQADVQVPGALAHPGSGANEQKP